MVEAKIDNLSPDASAEEMRLDAEAAIKALEEQAELKADKPEESIEEEEEKTTKVDKQPETVETEAPLEAVEELTEIRQKAKSYDDLRPWITRMSQDIAEVKKGQMAQPRQPERVQQPEATLDQWQESYDRDPVRTTYALAQQATEAKTKGLEAQVQALGQVLGTIINKSSVDKFRTDSENYPGFVEMEEEVKEVLRVFPEEITSNPQYNDRLLDFGYKAVRGKRAEANVRKAREQGRKEILDKKEAKKEAHVEGSGKSEPEKPFDLSNASAQEIYEYGMAKGISETGV